MKAYLLTKTGYNYDDNYYTKNEDGSGRPLKIFFNKEEGKKELKKLEIKEHTINDFHLYFYDGEYSEVLKNEDRYIEFVKEMNIKYPKETNRYGWDDSEFIISPKLTEEEKTKYISFFNRTVFFSLEEVELDEADTTSFLRDHRISEALKESPTV